LKEYGDKISADKKTEIEAALAEVKTAHQAQDMPALDAAMEKLNTVFQAASQEMYANANNAESTTNANTGDQEQKKDGNSEVTDVDYEEVK
jgi:molecular chaperone DnaK